MILLGILLVILSLLFPLKLGILFTIGIILIVVGLVLLALGQFGHPVGGRRFWY
jgi:hypothetical protein